MIETVPLLREVKRARTHMDHRGVSGRFSQGEEPGLILQDLVYKEKSGAGVRGRVEWLNVQRHILGSHGKVEHES